MTENLCGNNARFGFSLILVFFLYFLFYRVFRPSDLYPLQFTNLQITIPLPLRKFISSVIHHLHWAKIPPTKLQARILTLTATVYYSVQNEFLPISEGAVAAHRIWTLPIRLERTNLKPTTTVTKREQGTRKKKKKKKEKRPWLELKLVPLLPSDELQPELSPLRSLRISMASMSSSAQ